MNEPITILILEDEAEVAEELRLNVERLGYRVTGVARTGEEALALARSQAPDLALVDIVLPGGMDGIEVAERFRRERIPVVYLTAHADEQFLERAKVTEPYGYILKPCAPRDLQANIAMALYKAHAERQIAERNQLYATLFSFCEAIVGTDCDGKIVLANEAASRLLGLPQGDMLGRRLEDVVRLTDRATDQAATEEVLYQVEQQPVVSRDGLRLSLENGKSIDVAVGASRILTAEGERLGTAVLIQDVTERNRVMSELYKFSTAADQTADAVMITDPAGVIEYVNKSFEVVTGFTRDEVLGMKPSILKSGYHEADFYKRLWSTIAQGQPFRDVFINSKKDGTVYFENKTITPLKAPNGTIIHYLSVGSDITQRMQTEERLQHYITHDIQTDLPNRALFQDRLGQALLNAQRAGRTLAVVFLGIDRMKVINETLGRAVGDACIREVAARLERSLRPGDTVARFAGDEFAILLEDMASADDIAPVTRVLLERASAPMKVGDRELVLTLSAGVSVAPLDSSSADELIRCAETAMENAKRRGKNRYEFFTPDMNARAIEHLNMESALRHALARKEFVLHYQPIFSLGDGVLTGFEALLRWNHPELGLVQPSDFIPILEETGLIVPVGLWVLREACMQQRQWESRFGAPVTMAVNLSPHQLDREHLDDEIAEVLAETGVPAERLYLEVTESMMIRDIKKGARTLQAIGRLGINLAVDDFGTGYSSLAYLTRLPVNTLKVDRSFVRDVPANESSNKVAQSIVALGRSLGLRIVAEGVETHQQARFLLESQCGYAQGYLFGRPQPADACDAIFGMAAGRGSEPD